MRDALDSYFLNQVIKIAKPESAFSWTGIVDEIISKYEIPFDGGESLEAHIYAFKMQGNNFEKQLNTLLDNGYIRSYEKDPSKYLLTKRAIDARSYNSVEDYESTMTPILVNSKINDAKFDKKIILFLKRQSNKFGDISQIVNKFINKNQDNRKHIYHRLIYLKRERNIIYIKDVEDVENEPMKAVDDWWGNLITVDFNKGEKVEGLKAKLSKEYLDKLFEKEETLKKDIRNMILTALFSLIVGYFLFQLHNKSQVQTDKQQDDRIQKISDSVKNLYTQPINFQDSKNILNNSRKNR